MPARREKSLGRPERLAATLNLDALVARVPGVSSARTSALAKMGITTVRDLLAHYPRRYLDMSHVVTVADAPIGALVTVSGTVHEVKLKKPRPRLTLTEITVVDRDGRPGGHVLSAAVAGRSPACGGCPCRCRQGGVQLRLQTNDESVP